LMACASPHGALLYICASVQDMRPSVVSASEERPLTAPVRPGRVSAVAA
jgi:hypothetical protein